MVLPQRRPLDVLERGRLIRRVKALSWLSLGWMTVEGAVAIAAGLAASSVALVGFGLDSAIEGFASVVIIWRFTGARMLSAAAEARAQKLVAVQFFLLAPYVAIESARSLAGGEHPDPAPSESLSRWEAWSSCRSSGWPSSDSPTASGRLPPGARAARTCSAPTSPERCWWASSETRWPERGGSTPPSACSSQPWR